MRRQPILIRYIKSGKTPKRRGAGGTIPKFNKSQQVNDLWGFYF